LKAVLDCHARLLRRSLVEAADDFLIQLEERTGKPTREIEPMPLLDAVRLLDRSLAPEATDRPAPLTQGETTAAGADGSPRGDRQAAAADASATAAPSDPPEGDGTGPPADPGRTPRVDRQPAAVMPTEGTPLEITLTLLKGTSKARSLVRFISEQSTWKATLKNVTRHLYSKSREPTIRQQEKARH
jgi:hypothetical protein